MTLLSPLSSSQQAGLASQSVMELFSSELEQEIDAILAHGGPFTRGPNSVSPLVINVRRSPPRCVAPPRWLRLHCGTCTNQEQQNMREELQKESEQLEWLCTHTNTNSIQNKEMDESQRVKSKIKKRRKHVSTSNTEKAECKDNVYNNDAETLERDENINHKSAAVLECDTKRSYRHINAPEHLLDCVDSPSATSSIATSLLASRATELNYQHCLPSPSESAASNVSDCLKHTPVESSIHIDLTESMMSSSLHECNNITRKEPIKNNVSKSYQHYAKNKHGQTKSNNKNNKQQQQEKNSRHNKNTIQTQLSHHEQYNQRVIPAPLLIWSEVCVNENTSAPEVKAHVITILMESSSNQFMKAHMCSNKLSNQSENNNSSNNKEEESMSSKAIQGVLLLPLSAKEFDTYTVHDVKRAIRKRISVAVPTQQLFFQGVKLCDELPIALLNTDTLVFTLQIASTSSYKESSVNDDDVGEESLSQNVKHDAHFATRYHQHHSVNNSQSRSFTDNSSNISSTANSSLLPHASLKKKNYKRASQCEQLEQRNDTISSSSLESSFQSSAHISEVTQDEMEGLATTTTKQLNVIKESNKNNNNFYDKINGKIRHTKSQREDREKDTANYLKRALIDALPPISMLNNIAHNNKWQQERYKKAEREQQKRITSMLTEMSLPSSSSSSTSSNDNNYNNKCKYKLNKNTNKHTSSTNNLERLSANVDRNRLTRQAAGDWDGEDERRGSGEGTGGVDAWSSDSTTSDDDIDEESNSNSEVDDKSKVVTNNHSQHKRKTLGIHVV